MKITPAQKRSLTILINEGGAAWSKATNIALLTNLVKKGLIRANFETNKYEVTDEARKAVGA